ARPSVLVGDDAMGNCSNSTLRADRLLKGGGFPSVNRADLDYHKRTSPLPLSGARSRNGSKGCLFSSRCRGEDVMLRPISNRAWRRFALLAVLVSGYWLETASVQAQGVYRIGSELIPQSTANEHGLDRVWATRVNVDRSRGRVANITQHGRTLFVQTT